MEETRQALDIRRWSPQAEALRQFLASRLVGQERAIDHVVSRYELFRSPLRQDGKPILKSLFMGPSGCGKTHLVECLAEFLFEDPHAMTKIDCGQLTSYHEVTSTLIGAPPGYIGFDRPPRLSQREIDIHAWRHRFGHIVQHDPDASRVWKQMGDVAKPVTQENPPLNRKDQERTLNLKRKELQDIMHKKISDDEPLVSIILFDEFEKADRALQRFLYGPFDTARVKLHNGDETDLSHSFMFMTANIAAKEIGDLMSGKGRIGFSRGDQTKDSVYHAAMRETRKIFEPAFLGRLDDIVVFRPLTNEELWKIFDLEIARLHTKLAKEFPLELVLSPAARNFIFGKATDHPELGARLLREKVEHYLYVPMSRLINSGQAAKADRVLVDTEPTGEGLAFSKDVFSFPS